MALKPGNISRHAGVGGYKSGKFGQIIAATKQHNQIVSANLKLSMAAVPKFLLGAYAGTALDQAIRVTKHDSSRFAANWNLAIGQQALLNEGRPFPHDYNKSDESFGTVGTKGDKRRFFLRVLTAKRMYYGYRNSAKGSEYMMLTKGKLAAALFPRANDKVKATGGNRSLANVQLSFDEMAGEPPAIYLYNPFMRPDSIDARLDGGGRSYPENALPDEGAAALKNEVAKVMGKGLLQEVLVKLAAEMRAANAAGKIVRPMP